jgi:hypothetical protein
MSNKPGNVLLYDSLDKPNANQQIAQKDDWRKDIPKYVFFAFLLLFGLVFFFVALYGMINSYNDAVAYTGWFIIISYLFSVVFLVFGRLSIYLYTEYNKANKERLVNVFEYQTTYDRLDNILAPYFDAMQTRMQQSIFSGVQNLTYSPTNTRNEQVQEPQKQIDVDTPVVVEELPALEQLQRDNMIGRSGNSILLGFENDNT